MTPLDDSAARIDRLFGTLVRMNDADLMAMNGAWTGGDAALRQDAWAKVRTLPVDDPRSQLLVESRERLSRWVNDVGITWVGAYERSIIVPSGADQGNLRRNAVPAILDALVAEAFEDLLTSDERDELLDPFRRVTEPQTADE